MSNENKLCERCKVVMIEIIKSVYRCSVCKVIENNRLEELQTWEKPNKNNDLEEDNG